MSNTYSIDQNQTGNNILLIFPPWGSLEQPSLAFGLIKAILNTKGLDSDVTYLNLQFAEYLGINRYRSLKDRDVMVCEWVFAEAAFGKFHEPDEFMEFLSGLGYSPTDLDIWADVQRAATPFIESCLDDLQIQKYKVLGFTTSMMQSLPSLALAKRAKQINPNIKIVFGGANCEGEMGEAMMENFEFIDVVVRRDCDAFVADLFERLCNGESIEDLPICSRGTDGVLSNPMPDIFHNLDLNPFPDYDDYFDQLSRTSYSDEIRVNLVFEGSRGCWYGQKVACTFCAVTGSSMEYRSKSPSHLVDELEYLANRHGVTWFGAADNILDFRSQKTLCDSISKRIPNAKIFFDVKANLTRAQIIALKNAGIDEVQPGIESFSTPVLKLMKKGTTGIRNIHVLRMFAEIGIWPMWNYLYGFPGEKVNHYEPLIEQMSSGLFHLPAPYVGFGLSMMRFSAYFQDPEKYGIKLNGPLPHYKFIFNLPESEIERLAYYFQFKYENGYDPSYVGKLVTKAVDDWQKAYYVDQVSLTGSCLGNEVVIQDTRFGEKQIYTLDEVRSNLYRLLERPRCLNKIIELFRIKYPSLYLQISGQSGLLSILEEFATLHIIFRENDRIVGIIVPEVPDDFWQLLNEDDLTDSNSTVRPKPSILHWKVKHLHETN